MNRLSKLLSLVLSLALLLTMAPAALASTDAEREALAEHLQQVMPYEEIITGTGTEYGYYLSTSCFNAEEAGSVVIYANGSGIDGAVSKIVSGAEDADTNTVMLMLLNYMGKMAKVLTAYGWTEEPVYFMYVTDAGCAGGQYCFMAYVDIVNDMLYIMTDEIFGLQVALVISGCYDENYEFITEG